MAEPAPCPDDQLLVGLSLGHLTGRQRAGALAHLGECTGCRAKVLDLVEVGEQLLLATPPAEPPAGFEAEVLSLMGHEPAPVDPLIHRRTATRPWRGPILVAAAAVLVVALAFGAFAVAAGPPATAETAMVTDSGRDVGRAWRHEGDPSWVFVSVPRWEVWEEPGAEPLRYVVTAELDDGSTVELGQVDWSAGGSWGTTTRIDAERISSVAVVDHTGREWCRGEF